MLLTKEKIKKLKPNKEEIIFSFIILCSLLLASNVAAIVFRESFKIIAWSSLFAVFLIFFRAGDTKNKQLFSVILYSIITYIMLVIFAYSMTLPIGFYVIIRAIIIFLCLCTSRYLPHGRTPGIFLIVYLLILMLLNNKLAISTQLLPHIYSQLLIGLIIGLLCTLLFLSGLPFITVPKTDIDKSTNLIKWAIRITISLNIAFLISSIFKVTNTAWICFAIITISQKTIGDSIQKAFRRIIGTIVGGIVGAILANFLFHPYPKTLSICYPLLFIAFLFINKSYAIFICIMTIIVAASFYFFSHNLSLNQFIISRILDTLLGILIGLAGEMFIFPTSIMPTIRKTIHELFYNLSQITKFIAHPDKEHKIKNLIQNQNSIMKEIKDEMNIIKYEPIIYISKRSSYVLKIHGRLKQIHSDIKGLGELNKISKDDLLICSQLTKTLNFMQTLSPKTPHIDDLEKAIKKLENLSNSKNISNKNQNLQKIIIDINKLLVLYKEAYLTPYWLPRFR